MKLLGIPLGSFQTNCYILIDEKTNQAVVIDPGSEPERLIKELNGLKADVKAVLLTHGHGDHIGAVEALRKETGAPLYVHPLDAAMLGDANCNLSSFTGEALACKESEHLVKEDDIIQVGEEIKLQVIFTPGHTQGGVCYYAKDQGLLFAGDTLFAESIGRTDFPGGSYGTLIQNIKDKLMTLPGETRVFPGHGPETTIEWEKDHNPFIR